MSISSCLSSSWKAQRHSYKFAWIILIGANIFWASSYVAGKFSLASLPVTLMLALRMLIAALVLSPFLWLRRHELRLGWHELGQLALLSLIGFVVNKLFEFGGLALSTASDVALLIAGESLFTAIFSWLWLHEPVRKRTALALGLGLVGVYLIVERSLWPVLPSGGGVWRVVGDLLVIGGLVLEAGYTVRGKSLLLKHSPLLITAASIVGSTVFWLPMAVWSFAQIGWQLPSLANWLTIIWLAVFCTVLAYLAWFAGLARVNGSVAASTLFIQPLFGTVLAIVLLHDQITTYTLVGGVLILISVYLTNFKIG